MGRHSGGYAFSGALSFQDMNKNGRVVPILRKSEYSIKNYF
jgi:hypothetical protein